MAYQLNDINAAVRRDPLAFMEEGDAQYQAKIVRAADRICENMKQSPVVLLSGPSGSGKTTTARKLEAEQLAEYLRAAGADATACGSVADGVKTAMELAGADGVVLCFGSLYSIGSIRDALVEMGKI